MFLCLSCSLPINDNKVFKVYSQLKHVDTIEIEIKALRVCVIDGEDFWDYKVRWIGHSDDWNVQFVEEWGKSPASVEAQETYDEYIIKGPNWPLVNARAGSQGLQGVGESLLLARECKDNKKPSPSWTSSRNTPNLYNFWNISYMSILEHIENVWVEVKAWQDKGIIVNWKIFFRLFYSSSLRRSCLADHRYWASEAQFCAQ